MRATMTASDRTWLLLGTNRLAIDAAAAIRSEGAAHSVVTAGDWPSDGDTTHHELDLTRRAAAHSVREVLGTVRPTDLVVLVRSQTPLVPARSGSFDVAIAKSVAAGVQQWCREGGSIEHLTVLSATAVYGLARAGTLLFEESGSAGEDATPNSAYAIWVSELREAERCYARLANEIGAALTVLRAAPVVGGPIESLITEYLSAPMLVRVAGFDPPLQVLHYRDLLTAVARASVERPSMPMNIVARGVVPLSRLSALVGRIAVPLPGTVAERLVPGSVGSDFLSYRCIADGTRALEAMSFSARYTTEEALSV
jgi:hypothetical protein